MKTILKSWVLVLSFLAEISLGIFMYLHFDNLLLRFLFFVWTAILMAFLIVKMADDDDINDGESFTENDEQLAE
ncbi:MAG TPA: hypothetical protein VFM82_12430 [Flavobacteriaceae bacterium]|nr:hypothetical protein [Flavobacteriaceae bacterium]